MGLKEYLKFRRLSYREFGKIIGVSGHAIFSYVHRKKMPSLETAKKIEDATGKKVKMEDLLPEKKEKS